MSKQSAMRMSREQPIVQNMVQNEPAQGETVAIPDSPEYRKDVVRVINFVIGWTDERWTLRERLKTARSLITYLRERSPMNAQSCLLRDAERYLWGRAYVPTWVDEAKAAGK